MSIVSRQQTSIVGVFPGLAAAGQALDQLVLHGFPLAQIYLLSGEGERAAAVTLAGAETVRLREHLHDAAIDAIVPGPKLPLTALGHFSGGVSGLLIGLVSLMLPGVGPVFAGAGLAYVLLSGLICTVTGGLIGTLASLGITEAQAMGYADQVAKGNCLLLIRGAESEIFRAEHILYAYGIQLQHEC